MLHGDPDVVLSRAQTAYARLIYDIADEALAVIKAERLAGTAFCTLWISDSYLTKRVLASIKLHNPAVLHRKFTRWLM